MGKASKSSSTKAQKVKRPTEKEAQPEDADSLSRCFLCGEDAGCKICADCGSAAYCSEAHLKLHRPEQLCFPFRVDSREGVGRCLIATRDIQPMGKIIEERFRVKNCIVLNCTYRINIIRSDSGLRPESQHILCVPALSEASQRETPI